MNSPIQPLNPGAKPMNAEPAIKLLTSMEEAEEQGFMSKLAEFWEDRYVVLATLIVFMLMGGFYLWWAPPTWQADAMLQITAKKDRPMDSAVAKLENLFPDPAEAEAEVEIIRATWCWGAPQRPSSWTWWPTPTSCPCWARP